MAPSIGALLAQAARRFGDRTALIFGDKRWSFRQLNEAASQLASSLARQGIGRGDTVSL